MMIRTDGINNPDPEPEPQNPYPDARTMRVPFLSQPVGLGDVVSRLTQSAGIKPCQPCKARQEALNRRMRLMPW